MPKHPHCSFPSQRLGLRKGRSRKNAKNARGSIRRAGLSPVSVTRGVTSGFRRAGPVRTRSRDLCCGAPHSGCRPWSHPARFPSTLAGCWVGWAFKPTLKGQTHPEGPVSVGNLVQGAPPWDAWWGIQPAALVTQRRCCSSPLLSKWLEVKQVQDGALHEFLCRKGRTRTHIAVPAQLQWWDATRQTPRGPLSTQFQVPVIESRGHY